jgi:hypothetical protein
VATNAGLTSLASLVTAVSAQRTLAPPSKDGLSALSYAKRPDRTAVAEPGPSETPSDDEPMPIPSTWRQPVYDDDRSYRQQMGAALLGLAAGLVIVVPTVLWMSGWFEAHRSNPALSRLAASEPKVAEVRTMKVQVQPVEKPAEPVAQYVTGSVAPRTVVETVPVVADQPTASALAARFAEPPTADAQVQHNDLIAQASQRVENGDLAGAREMLSAADDGSQGLVAFALAETYDPNMLAAWGTRGVAADVARARALYRKALGLGVASAQSRLEALK